MNHIKRTAQEKFVSVFSYIMIGILALVCLIPFLLVVSASFSSERDIITYGFSLIPRNISFESYKLIFNSPRKILDAYQVTIFVAALGSLVSLLITAMTAYVLMRKNFFYRHQVSFYFYFTSLFSGGMIPSYILISEYLHLKDSIWVLIIPHLLSAWNVFLMRNFMKEIPEAIAESATIDGANEFTIFVRLYLPLSEAGLATIGLFIGLMFWNDWYSAMLYINKPRLYPLQYLLYDMLNSINAIQEASQVANIPVSDMPSESFKMAMAVIVTGPIIFLYPFVQKYFVKGLTVGSVKG